MIDHYLVQENRYEAASLLEQARTLANSKVLEEPSFIEAVQRAHNCMDVCEEFIGVIPINSHTRIIACHNVESRGKEIQILKNRIHSFQHKLNSFQNQQ